MPRRGRPDTADTTRSDSGGHSDVSRKATRTGGAAPFPAARAPRRPRPPCRFPAAAFAHGPRRATTKHGGSFLTLLIAAIQEMKSDAYSGWRSSSLRGYSGDIFMVTDCPQNWLNAPMDTSVQISQVLREKKRKIVKLLNFCISFSSSLSNQEPLLAALKCEDRNSTK